MHTDEGTGISQRAPSFPVCSRHALGKAHLPMSMMALLMGGHIRVGMEDNIYYEKGKLAKTNAEFVDRIVRLAREYGREIANPEESKKILGL